MPGLVVFLIIMGIILGMFGISFGTWLLLEEDDFVGLAFLVIGIVILAAGICGLIDASSNNPKKDEYTYITERLEINPFDESVIKEAVIYNSKIDMADKLDGLSDNEYEEYINEPKIDVEAIQIRYIDENYGLDKILAVDDYREKLKKAIEDYEKKDEKP